MEIDQKFLDVPYDKPSIPIPLDLVAVSNRKEYIKIRDIFNKRKHHTILCDLEIGISLSKRLRGIHMSRIENAITQLSSKVYDSLCDFTSVLSKKIYNEQTCNSVKVEAKGTINHIIKTPKTKIDSCQPIDILSLSIYNGKKTKKIIGIENNIMIACPCVQRYFSQFFLKSNKKKFNIESLGKLITHTQRGKLSLLIENSDDILTYKDIFSITKNSAVFTSELLKRPDERYIILEALTKADFVEDIVRKTANNSYEYLSNKGIKRNRSISIKVVSYESIHSHNVRAELETNLNELRKYLLKKNHE